MSTAWQGYRSPRQALAVIIAASVAVAVVACGGGASAGRAGPEKPNLVVDAVPAEGAAGLFLAQEKGLFARQGLHVTIEKVTSSSTVLPAMLKGTVDVASGQYTSYIGADAAGAAKMRILAAGYSLGPHVQEVIVPARTHITSMAGLKGKTIAVNALDSETSDLLDNVLATYGLSPSQVHLVAVPFPEMLQELATGQIDAAYEIEPYITKAARQNGVQVLADIDSGAAQDFPIAGYGVLASWAAKYPRTAAAFARAIRQGNAIAATDLAALQHAFVAELHLSPSVAGVMATGTFPTTADPVQLQRVADLMLRYGQLKHPFQVKSILGP